MQQTAPNVKCLGPRFEINGLSINVLLASGLILLIVLLQSCSVGSRNLQMKRKQIIATGNHKVIYGPPAPGGFIWVIFGIVNVVC